MTAQREALVRTAGADDHPERRSGLLCLAHRVAQLLEIAGNQPGVFAGELAEKARQLAQSEPGGEPLGSFDLAVGLDQQRYRR